jgi:hypothetical protein
MNKNNRRSLLAPIDGLLFFTDASFQQLRFSVALKDEKGFGFRHFGVDGWGKVRGCTKSIG